ncbi:MAG: NAD(P)H-binding protein, partial [Corynebacterium sp.]|nr:NAD(P)H-binding protein [Corynebacterium sp.]
MRIAVVGATGNTGTAVLRALHRHPEITEVVSIARRLPDTEIEPYDQCEWLSIDIAAASTEADAAKSLTDAFRGCDAVIHLAWMIQPNDRRELLERVNVEGARRVTRAVAEAGVEHLVVASSVGVYSPDEARDALRK